MTALGSKKSSKKSAGTTAKKAAAAVKASTEAPAATEPQEGAQNAAEGRVQRGRPVMHTEPWAKITVVLLDRHVAYLDRMAIDIRLKHGKAISRAEIIRGLVEAAEQSGIDFSSAASVEDITHLMLKKK